MLDLVPFYWYLGENDTRPRRVRSDRRISAIPVSTTATAIHCFRRHLKVEAGCVAAPVRICAGVPRNRHPYRDHYKGAQW